jgi:hypothetical protein
MGTISVERDGLRDMLEAVAVSRAKDRRESSKVRSRPWGHWGVSGGTVQVPPTRDGDPPSLTEVCDTFVTLS